MTAQQLKNSILQMAIQGKLVSQDPNDEPASVLIQKIRKEKEQMIKDGKIKKEKNPSFIFRGDDGLFYEKVGDKEPVCIKDDVPFDIPDSWEWIRVKQFTLSRNGKAFKPSDWSESGLPIVRIQNLNDHSAPYNYYNGSIEPEYLLQGDELLFAWSGTPGTSFGAHIWYGNEAVLNQHIFKLEFDESLVYKPYYMYALNQRVSLLISEAHGSAGLQHVTKDVFENTLIPLPPYNEQKRIVSKLEYLTPRINEYDICYDNLETLNNSFPDQLKKSILQFAIQGKLVPQDPDDEPASVLIERIHDEKEQFIKDGKVKRDKHESAIYKRSESFYEITDGKLQCIDDEIPFEIPDSWEWVRLGNIIELVSGTDFKPTEYNDLGNGTPYITGASNFTDDKVIVSRWTTTPKNIANKGDVLLVCKGSGYGKTVICNVDSAHIARQIMAIKKDVYLDMDYIRIFLQANINYLKSKGQGVIPGIDRKSILNMMLPLPPFQEQNRIVEKVNQLFAIINGL